MNLTQLYQIIEKLHFFQVDAKFVAQYCCKHNQHSQLQIGKAIQSYFEEIPEPQNQIKFRTSLIILMSEILILSKQNNNKQFVRHLGPKLFNFINSIKTYFQVDLQKYMLQGCQIVEYIEFLKDEKIIGQKFVQKILNLLGYRYNKIKRQLNKGGNYVKFTKYRRQHLEELEQIFNDPITNKFYQVYAQLQMIDPKLQQAKAQLQQLTSKQTISESEHEFFQKYAEQMSFYQQKIKELIQSMNEIYEQITGECQSCFSYFKKDPQ